MHITEIKAKYTHTAVFQQTRFCFLLYLEQQILGLQKSRTPSMKVCPMAQHGPSARTGPKHGLIAKN